MRLMSNFYTNVQVVSGNILYRGVLDGKRVKQKIEYSEKDSFYAHNIGNTFLEKGYKKMFWTRKKYK